MAIYPLKIMFHFRIYVLLINLINLFYYGMLQIGSVGLENENTSRLIGQNQFILPNY